MVTTLPRIWRPTCLGHGARPTRPGPETPYMWGGRHALAPRRSVWRGPALGPRPAGRPLPCLCPLASPSLMPATDPSLASQDAGPGAGRTPSTATGPKASVPPPVPKRGCPRALVHSPWGLLGGRPFAHPAPRRLQPLRGLRAGCPGLPPADYVGQALAQAAAAPGPCGGMRSITRQTQQAPPPQRRQHSADDWGRGLSGCRPCGSPVIRCAVCSRWSRGQLR